MTPADDGMWPGRNHTSGAYLTLLDDEVELLLLDDFGGHLWKLEDESDDELDEDEE